MLSRSFNSCLVGLLLAVVLTTSSGCTGIGSYFRNGFKVGPNYAKPAAPVSNDWIDSYNPKVQRGEMLSADWWKVFNDKRLDAVIEIAYQQNISIREAGFRIAESQAMRSAVAGNLWPQSQQLTGDYARLQRSQQTATFPQGGALPPGLLVTNYDNWSLGGAIGWELDFWGRYRRSIEAADANLDASIEAYDDALVLLIAETASAYIDYRTFEQRIDYALTNIQQQKRSADIRVARKKAEAINSEIDAPQSLANLTRTEAAVHLLELAKRQTQNRLAVLLGMPPHDLSYILGPSRGVPKVGDTVTLDVPASLLRRRPDVRRAERLVAAQSEQIGIAQTDLYPTISINGALTMEASQFPNLFAPNAWQGSVGPGFRWNVLNYGRLRNLVSVQDAILEQRIAAYQQTVLVANEEAENAIVSFLRYQMQRDKLEESVGYAQEAVRVVNQKEDKGQVDYTQVFDLETLLVQQQDEYATSQGNVAKSMVQIYKAMGGGWEIRFRQPMPYAMPNMIERLPPPMMEMEEMEEMEPRPAVPPVPPVDELE
ncbi:RND efflux system, outer membrane lipoprotein, NodT family [Pirellula staleyi DSM 6068]|uniref:RND efflux system, outer membrane lipoprotein, NodT family n=1 Tax=Pirellula staleyi (strain ATCC 27377 / DSM 6068 / ICPB 4128) TaxID=530564 RepID=D2QW77_PIRSD|nr:efflux transporter outer membrane subunit [Pirellula staleyi]ADB15952.1 RND efflux system, outer membrane lipoprotein, NodT family [Pirellula staleyi DSM 6068]